MGKSLVSLLVKQERVAFFVNPISLKEKHIQISRQTSVLTSPKVLFGQACLCFMRLPRNLDS